MNASPTDTRHPHLDLGVLIAEAAGREWATRRGGTWPAAGTAKWRRSGGISSPNGPWPGFHRDRDSPGCTAAANPSACRAAWRRAIPGGRRRGSGAGPAGRDRSLAGVVHVHVGGHSPEPVLTSVSGCSRLEQADGTLEGGGCHQPGCQTASGRPVTVTTTASTFVSMSGALLSEITDGASVVVHGYGSDGTVQAAIVTVGQPFPAVNPPGMVALEGIVSTRAPPAPPHDAHRNPGLGDHLDRHVVVPHASPGQLQPGTHIFALGNVGPDGTLSGTPWRRYRNSGRERTPACG